MPTKAVAMVFAVLSALTVGMCTRAGSAHADVPTVRTSAATTDHNPLAGYEGYCTWGAQEQIHAHTGYYVTALTGNAESWAEQARTAGWTVVSEPVPHSIAVLSGAQVGGVGHVAWVDAVNGADITVTEMNYGPGASAENGYRTAGFDQFDTRTMASMPGTNYIVLP